MGSASRRFDGFFKSEFRVNETVGRSVSYVRDGKLLGGNSGFAHIGSYRFEGDAIAVEVTSRRHNFGPNFKSLLGSDISTIDVRGQAVGDAFHFEGGSPQMPTARFRSVMTPLDESQLAPPGTVGEDGISNGLYSIHLKVLDGMAGGLTGVVLLNNGRIFGGDAFFYYLGSYSSSQRPMERPDGQSGTHPGARRRPGIRRTRDRDRIFRNMRCARRHPRGYGAGRQAEHTFRGCPRSHLRGLTSAKKLSLTGQDCALCGWNAAAVAA